MERETWLAHCHNAELAGDRSRDRDIAICAHLHQLTEDHSTTISSENDFISLTKLNDDKGRG
jgi:hypothetical protein